MDILGRRNEGISIKITSSRLFHDHSFFFIIFKYCTLPFYIDRRTSNNYNTLIQPNQMTRHYNLISFPFLYNSFHFYIKSLFFVISLNSFISLQILVSLPLKIMNDYSLFLLHLRALYLILNFYVYLFINKNC